MFLLCVIIMMRNNRSSNDRSSVVKVAVVAVVVGIVLAIVSNSGRCVVSVVVECVGQARLRKQARARLGC